jgi:general secretion pathway protein A
MYQSYWGLAQAPFRAALDPRFFYQGLAQEEALARLHFLAGEHRALGLLLGGPGSGKSLLLEVFAGQLPKVNVERALVNVGRIGPHEFAWELAAQLGVEVSPAASSFALWRAVVDHLVASRYQEITTVLLLDDADEAGEEVLGEIARLAQIDVARDALLTIVLSAQPGRLRRLGARLLELTELRIDVDGWEADETAAFVKSALALCGRSTAVFSEAALVRLHERAGGVPRRVKQLADLALLAGAGRNLVQIEADTLDSVSQELGVATASVQAVAAAR